MLDPRTSSPTFRQRKAVEELVKRYHAGELGNLKEKDLEQIAILAAQFGIEFRPESKPIRKGLFDLADTATFGLLPNKWRPHSIGQEWHGESGIDKFAGGLGTVGGGLALGAGVLKGARWAAGKMPGMPNMPDFTQPFRGNIFGRSGGGIGGGPISRTPGVGPYGSTYTSGNKLATLNYGRDKILGQAYRNTMNPRIGDFI